MEEKILIKSVKKSTKKPLALCFLCGVVLALMVYVLFFAEDIRIANECMSFQKEEYEAYQGKDKFLYEAYKEDYEENKSWRNEMLMVTALCFVVPTMLGVVLYFVVFRTELVVTNKRIYGKIAFDKRVDLPLDSVSAIASSWPKGIAVSTSSGKIAFSMIENRNEIHKCISDLLIERQSKFNEVPLAAAKPETSMNNVNELRKYKELLDEGVITQEEFDAKKKQLLGA